MKDYPLPSYASSIWLADDQIYLAFPDERGGHTIHFPDSPRGYETMMRVLRERAMQTSARTLGLSGTPAQQEADHLRMHSQSPDDRCPFCIRATNTKRLSNIRATRQCGDVTVRYIAQGASQKDGKIQGQKSFEELLG